MTSFLFGNSGPRATNNLAEIKAGKMQLKGKMVHSDKRKGLLYLRQSDDGLMHFCWKDRTTGTVEEDLIIFPDDCEYKRIAACTTGRAYVLKFKSTTRRLFFWMQEAKTEKDEEFSGKVNKLLNNPPDSGSPRTPSRSGGLGGSSGGSSSSQSASAMLSAGDISNLRDSDLQNLLGNISQQQLMQLLGSGVPNLSSLITSNSSRNSSTPSTATSPTRGTSTPSSTSAVPMETSSTTTTSGSQSSSSGGAPKNNTGKSAQKEEIIKLADLQNILTNMISKEGTSSGSSEAVDLSPAFTAETLQPILSDSSFVEKLQTYLPETGEKLPPADQLKGTVTSPQFKQAVSLFSTALQSGQLGPLIKQFGLGEEAVLAAASGNMESFIKAISKSKKEEKKDEDDSMAVD